MTEKQKKILAKKNKARIKKISTRVTGVPCASYDMSTLNRCCVATIIRRRIAHPEDGQEIYCDNSKATLFNRDGYCDCKITYNKKGDYWYGDRKPCRQQKKSFE